MKNVVKIISIVIVFLLIGTMSIAASGKKVNNQKVDFFQVSGGSSNNVQYGMPYKGHVILVDPSYGFE